MKNHSNLYEENEKKNKAKNQKKFKTEKRNKICVYYSSRLGVVSSEWLNFDVDDKSITN